MGFDAVITGTLRRHTQTLEGIAEGLQTTPNALQLPSLNEYDSHALIAAIHPQPLGPADTPERYRAHFRILCDALAQWMEMLVDPEQKIARPRQIYTGYDHRDYPDRRSL